MWVVSPPPIVNDIYENILEQIREASFLLCPPRTDLGSVCVVVAAGYLDDEGPWSGAFSPTTECFIFEQHVFASFSHHFLTCK